MPNVYRSQYELWLELGDFGKFEVASFSSNFSLNAIPSAQCVLAVGRDAANIQKKAAIHNKQGSLREMVTAKVYLKAQGAWDDKANWPEGQTLIFDGRLTGIGYRKMGDGQVSYVASIIHWLSDMAFSSTLSEQSHPANPGKYSYRSIYAGIGTTSSGNPHGLSMLSADKFMSADLIRRDFWGNSIKPLFCKLTEKDTIQLTGELQGKAKPGSNDLAQAALSRIEGASGDSCAKPLSDYNVPLSLDMGADAGISLRVARSISQNVMRDTVESYATTTMWDVLVGRLSPTFAFGVVPLVNTALVVPYVPGLRGLYSKEVNTDDYNFVDLSAYIPRPIRGVGIYGGRAMNSNPATDPNAQNPRAVGIGGYYEPADPPRGMLLIRNAPPWLYNIPFTYSSAARTSGMRQGTPTNTATTVVNGSIAIKGGEDQKTANEVAALANGYFNRYAQTLYITEALRGRQGQLAGKLRFDISPGSNIKIGGSREQFIGGDDALGQDLVGSVMRVSTTISAESGRAGTGFQLAYIRTTSENENDQTSIDRHPLYSTKFLGAPLVDGYRFA